MCVEGGFILVKVPVKLFVKLCGDFLTYSCTSKSGLEGYYTCSFVRKGMKKTDNAFEVFLVPRFHFTSSSTMFIVYLTQNKSKVLDRSWG